MNYQETLDYLYSRLPVFHNIGAVAYKPGLEKSEEIMQYFSNPHLNYKTIHVGGTNGKGSVSHLLSAILQTAGYRVGLYTSPHLMDFGERIRINGKMIEPEYVVEFVKKHFDFLEKMQPSFFEATMAMAFKYFSDQQVDVVVVEVGLGGRLDSTNIIYPELSIITNIGEDHTQFLGDNLERIAYEKAGIIKNNRPVVIGERQQKEIEQVFRKKCAEMNASISFASDSIDLKELFYEKGKMIIETDDGSILISGLTGKFQLKNIATVFESVNQLKKIGFEISDVHVQTALENVIELSGLQGRWQILSEQPKIIVDTGHNVDGVKQVVLNLAEEKYRLLHIIFAMVDDKDVDSVLALLPKDAHYYFTEANTNRAIQCEILKEKASGFGLEGGCYKDVETAIKKAKSDAEVDDLIFVGGSNYLIGDALTYLIKEENSL